MFMLDVCPAHTKARELVNAWTCREIIVFSNGNDAESNFYSSEKWIL